MLVSLLFTVVVIFAILTMLAAWSMVNSGKHSVEIDWLEALFLSLISVVILIGWIAISSGQLGQFNLLWLSLALAAAGATVALTVWRSSGKPDRLFHFKGIEWQEYLLFGLLAVSTILFFRPHEYVLGGVDAGSYINMGAYLARTGSFIESSAATELLVEYGETTLRQQPPRLRTSQLQFVGWYIDDADASRMLFQFLPFHPALIAVLIALAGLKGGLLTVPIWGVLSIAAVYFVARQLFGKNVALLSATLLACTPTHIFFARYPTAEPLTLLLLFASLLAFQVLWDKDDRHVMWGVFGGAALGAAMLTRIDLPLILLIVLAAFAWRMWERKWHSGWTAFAAMLGISLLHMATFIKQMNWPYFINTYGAIIRYVNWNELLLAGTFIVLIAGVLLAIQRRSLEQANLSSMLTSWLESTTVRWLLVILVVGLSLFAYFLYPIVKPVGSATAWPSGDRFPVSNGENWVRIGWYVTPLGLAMATFGLAAILRREPLERLTPFLLIGVLTTFQYVYNIFNTPYHIYAMRRYVPIVIPMLMIYAAYGIYRLFRMTPHKVMRPVSAAIGLALVVGILYQGQQIAFQRDYKGATEQLISLNELLQPDALIVIAEPPENQFADALGVPLHFNFGHDVVTIRNNDGRVEEVLDRAISAAEAKKQPVQLIAIEPILPAVRDSIQLRPVTMFPFATDMLMNTFTDFPSVIQPVEYGIEIYDVTGMQSSSIAETIERADIDVGTLDSAYVGEGFFSKEIVPGSPTMRWTSENATVQVPAGIASPMSIDVTAMIYRPDGVSAVPVMVLLDGAQIGEFTPDQSWQTYSFDGIGQPTDGYSTIEFQAETFNPSTLGISADTRELGFLIDRIVVVQP